MAFGYWSERLLHSHGTPRTLFMPAVSALLAAAFAALAFAPLMALFPLTAAAGFAYGEEGVGAGRCRVAIVAVQTETHML